MGTRRNISTDSNVRDAYVQGVLALKAEPAVTTDQIPSVLHPTGLPIQQLSTWDLFVLWHAAAMNQFTPTSQGMRNAAHSGPAFLPWHRWYLVLLEFQFQRVLGDTNFGLPYWDWAADGEQPPAQQSQQTVWSAGAGIGGDGDTTGIVQTGPFSESAGFRVHLEMDGQRRLWATDRPLRRRLGQAAPALPTKEDVGDTLLAQAYDAADWDTDVDEFRNLLEGWVPRMTAPHMHNLVHVWIGGDMGPGSSPNDPAFFLNHCNVDRIWAAWQSRNSSVPYRPSAGASAALFRHRRSDPLYSMLTSVEPTVSQMLDVSTFYDYDDLNVEQ